MNTIDIEAAHMGCFEPLDAWQDQIHDKVRRLHLRTRAALWVQVVYAQKDDFIFY